MAATDDEVLKAEQRVNALRIQLQEEQADRNTLLRDGHNDIIMARLDVEEKRLQAELAEAKNLTRDAGRVVKSTVKSAGNVAPEAKIVPDGAATTPIGVVPASDNAKAKE